MSDQDKRVDAAAQAIWTRQAWRHHTPWEDLAQEVRDEFLADARAALDAVQSQPTDDRRMVDRNVIEGLVALVVDVMHGRKHSGELLTAIKPYRREFGGSAPSEDQP